MTARVILFGGRRFGKTSALAALAKAHVPGYDRKDGKHIAAHETKAPSAKAAPQDLFGDAPAPSAFQLKYGSAKPAGGKPGADKPDWHSKSSWGPKPASASKYGGPPSGWAKPDLYGDSKPKGPPPAPKAWHPKANDTGGKVGIHNPHKQSDAAAWDDPQATATVPVGGECPAELHGVPFAPWADAPTTLEGWEDVPGQDMDLDEPDFDCPHDREAAAGVVIQEPDGRCWLVSPTNAFGGYKNTFPKGRADDGLSLQATAIKEAFEESGLQVEITGFLGDFERTQTYTRYYTARRVGGTPTEQGWETQAVRLAPHAGFEGLLNGSADKPVREALAGLVPPQP